MGNCSSYVEGLFNTSLALGTDRAGENGKEGEILFSNVKNTVLLS
jgi:hypothetical protein